MYELTIDVTLLKNSASPHEPFSSSFISALSTQLCQIYECFPIFIKTYPRLTHKPWYLLKCTLYSVETVIFIRNIPNFPRYLISLLQRYIKQTKSQRFYGIFWSIVIKFPAAIHYPFGLPKLEMKALAGYIYPTEMGLY